jgi:micrococcal nuclease
MKKSVLGTLITILLAGTAGYGYTIIRDNDADIFESSVHQVEYVVDGDTLDIEEDVRIRLLGIDAPERAECGYAESKAFLQLLVADAHINIEKDITGADLYDRLLRYVYLPSDDIAEDDVLVNEAMVRAGHAKTMAVAPDNRYRDLLASAQDEARRAGKGLWGVCPQEDDEEEMQADAEPTNDECLIKGNISAKSYGSTYFLPGCANYNRVKIDLRRGEGYFCTEEEAIAAGFTRSESCISPS